MDLIKLDEFLKNVGRKIENGTIKQNAKSLYAELVLLETGSIETLSCESVDDLFTKLQYFNKRLLFYPKAIATENNYIASNLKIKSKYDLEEKMINSIKIGISVSAKDAERISKKIMYFLSGVSKESKMIKHNLHIIPLGNRVNITMEVFSLQDVESIVSYCNEDFELKYKLLDPNPLYPNVGKISLFYEETLSYDYVFIYWVLEYLKNRREHNSLDKLGSRDFSNFVHSQFKNIFQKGRGVSEFLLSKYHGNGKRGFYNDNSLDGLSLEGRLLSFCNVTNLLLQALEGKTLNAKTVCNIRTFNQNRMFYEERLKKIRASRMVVTKEQEEQFKKIIDDFCIEKFEPLLSDGSGKDAEMLFEYLEIDKEYFCEATHTDLSKLFPKENTYIDYIRNLIINNNYSDNCPLDRLYRNLRKFSWDGDYSIFDKTDMFSKDNLVGIRDLLEEEFGMPFTRDESIQLRKNEAPYFTLGKRLRNAGLTADMVDVIRTNIMINALNSFTKGIISFYINEAESLGYSVSQALEKAKKDFYTIASSFSEVPWDYYGESSFEKAIVRFGIEPTWEMMMLYDEGLFKIINTALNLRDDLSVNKSFPSRPIVFYGETEELEGVKNVFNFEPCNENQETDYIPRIEYERNIINLYFIGCAKEIIKDRQRRK